MQAIILAAGMGKRLKELTKNNTKCMVKVNGVTLIERMLKQIDKKNLTRIVIVVGYEGKKLIDFIGTLSVKTPVCFIENPIYDKTNNIYSLALAKDWLVKDDTLLFESDLIFEDEVLDLLINDKRDTLALVDKYESWMDGTCLKLDADDNIIGFASGILGIFISWLLCFPINSVISKAVGDGVNVHIPADSAVFLIILSVVITVIGGLMPAKSAAKKDPVVALRTE